MELWIPQLIWWFYWCWESVISHKCLPCYSSVIIGCGVCLVQFKEYFLCICVICYFHNCHYSFVLFLLLNKSAVRMLYQCQVLHVWWHDLRQLCSIAYTHSTCVYVFRLSDLSSTGCFCIYWKITKLAWHFLQKCYIGTKWKKWCVCINFLFYLKNHQKLDACRVL